MSALQRRVRALRSNRRLRLLTTLVVSALAYLVLRWGFGFMRSDKSPKIAVMLVAIAVGVAGAWLLFWILDNLVSSIPAQGIRDALHPFVFVGPGLLLLLVFQIYPTVNTTVISFLDSRSELFVGLKNYVFVFTTDDLLIAFRNNVMWLVIVTTLTVCIGLLVAVLADRVRFESVVKSTIFLPMAISFVGASVIWKFVYAYRPAGTAQIGLINALVTALGGEPRGWLTHAPANSFFLMVIMIWIQTGFCMVILSAAIKGVPNELTEAARVDGANAFQIFFKITLPYIRGSIITVATTVALSVLRVFDIVYVMTNGQFKTQVIANRMYVEMFKFRDFGHAGALAVILLVAVTPVMIVNVRNLRQQRS
ncbi:MAG: sugar ABC transporter permease [Anaerolineae bacterium]